jgi:hypothetical protein
MTSRCAAATCLSDLADLDTKAGRAREEAMRLISEIQEMNGRRRKLDVDLERSEHQLEAARAELSLIE